MKPSEAYVGHADILTPFGWGTETQLTAITSGKSAYGVFDNKTYGLDFPVKYAGHIPDKFLEDFDDQNTRSEQILNQILKRFKSLGKNIKPDAFFLLYKNISAMEMYRGMLNSSNYLEKDSQKSVARIALRNGIEIAEKNIHIIDNTCCTGLTLLTNAHQGIVGGKWKNVLVCAIDLMDPYVLFTLNGIGAFANLEIESSSASRPFDLKRSGFVKTESASFALVTSDLNNLDETAILKIKSFNQTNDGYRITDGREDNKYIMRSMEGAMKRAGLVESDLAFIKAHGTSTQLNDLHEANAILALFSSRIPVTSLKGHLGHTTDASGLIENIIAGAALGQGMLLPTKNFEKSEVEINIVKKVILTNEKKYFLSNSFGFGGNNISAVFEIP